MMSRRGCFPVRALARRLRFASTAGLLLLAGCAAGYRTMSQVPQAPAYVPPAEGARATLLVDVRQPGGHYVVSTFEEPVSCSKRHEITSGTQPQPERVRTAIAAGRLQTLSFSYRQSRWTCEVTVSFEPVRGRTYLLRTGAEAQRCALGVFEAGGSAGGRVPEVQRQILGFARANDACRPLTSTVLPRPDANRPQSIDDFRQLLETR